MDAHFLVAKIAINLYLDLIQSGYRFSQVSGLIYRAHREN